MERTDPKSEPVANPNSDQLLSSNDLQKTLVNSQPPPVPATPRPVLADDKTQIRDLSGTPQQPEMTAMTVPGLNQTRSTQLNSAPTGAAQQTDVTQLHIASDGSSNAAGTHRGEVWGDFRIGELLGRGGMGAVYQGLQVSLDRPVAIKVLPQELSSNENFRNRFQLEAKAVAKLSSPNVIQVYAAGTHLGKHYFAMEYVEGKDIAMRMRAGFKPSPADVLELITQAARGLAAAGELGIVHRDIKPANMMLTSKGVLKIMDFGLVKLASEDQSLTMSGTIMGTVSYFSPEQGRGERCDSRTDIYALGVVFYELLTGQLPFRGADATSIIYQHIHAEPKPLREIDAQIPASFAAVVAKCMAKNADDRYQDAGLLVQDLTRLQHGQAPLAEAAGPSGGGARGPGRLVLLAVAAVAVVVIGGGLAVALHGAKAPASGAAAPATSPTVAPTVAVTTLTPAPQPTPTAAPQPNTPLPAVAAIPDPNLGMELIQQGKLDQARAMANQVLANAPGDAGWTRVAAAVEAARADSAMQALRQALDRHDLQAALNAQAQARAVEGNTAAMQALEQRLVDLQTRAKRIADAEGVLDNGDFAKAKEQLTTLELEQPGDPQVASLLARATAVGNRAEEVQKSVLEQLHNADLAIAQKDYDAALISYTAVKTLDPTSVAASTGLDRIAKIKSTISEVRLQFDKYLAAGDLANANTQLDRLRDLAPGSPTLVVAEDQLATAKLSTERSQHENDVREAKLVADAQALLKRLADPKEPLAGLESSAAALLPTMENGNAERLLIESRLADRRALDQVTTLLGKLDVAVVAGDRKTIGSLVTDAAFTDQLAQLHGYQGLVFETHLIDLQRHDQDATASVSIRNAMADSPESTLRYTYDLRRDSDAAWQIVSAHLLQ